MAAFTAYSVPVLPGAVTASFYAADNCNAFAGCLVRLSAGQVVIASGGTSKVFAVLAECGASSTSMVTVVIAGPAYFKAGATCSSMQYIAATSNGQGIPTTTTGHYMVGHCIANVSAGTYGKLVVQPTEHWKN